MRDIYIPEDPKPYARWPLRRPARRNVRRPEAWPNRGQLVVMLLGWLAIGGLLGALLAVLRAGS